MHIRFSALLSPPTLHGNPNSNLDQNVLVEDRQRLYKSCFDVLTWVQAVKNLFENLLRNISESANKQTSKHWSKWKVTISSLGDTTMSIKNTNFVIILYWFWVRFLLFIWTGRDRFYSNIEAMLGFPINPWCGWCWKYLSPIFCLVSTWWLSEKAVLKAQTAK